MKLQLLIFYFILSTISITCAQTGLGNGQEPQITLDKKGTIRLIYGDNDKIYYAFSIDNGSSFSVPVVAGEVREMHLGMARGPQLASSENFSIVAAIDKSGNIHSFRLDHQSGKWMKIKNVNDVPEIAKEGLMSLAADEDNNFYAVWLDLRNDQQNKIALSTLNKTGGWSKNRIIYKSPGQTVCECCKPSVAVRKNMVAIMFRNWINGSRDLHLITSSNNGKVFGEAQKLGNGTWKLRGCPMDGGGLLIDAENNIHTVWQREGMIFYAQPGQVETKLGNGRNCSISGKQNILISWQDGSELRAQNLNGAQFTPGNGRALKVLEVDIKTILSVWEIDEQIVFKGVEHH